MLTQKIDRMGTKREIGSALNEQLKSLGATPSDQVWDNLESELKKKKRRRLIPFWFWPIGIGMLLTGFILGGYFFNYFTNNSSNVKQSNTFVLDQEAKENVNIPEPLISNPAIKNSNIETNNKNVVASELQEEENTSPKNHHLKNTVYSANHTVPNKNNLGNIVADSQIQTRRDQNNRITFNLDEEVINQKTLSNSDIVNDVRSTAVSDSLINNFEDLAKGDVQIEKNNFVEVPKSKESDSIQNAYMNPWSVSASGMLTWYDIFKDGSLIDKRLDRNQVDRNMKLNYGIALHHNLYNKWTIRIGVNLVKYDQLTKNIDPNSINFQRLERVSYQVDEQLVSDFIDSSNDIEIRQDFTYLEIPIQARYSFVGDKIDLAAIVGLQNRLLLNDRIYLTSLTRELQIGKSENIYDYGVSAHLSLASRVHLFNKFYFNIEPAIYQHLQPFETDGVNLSTEFRVTTSLEYKF